MSDPCQLAVFRTGAGYLVRIEGRCTMRESPTVRDFVCGALEDGADVAIDLSRCEYLDSTFLGCLAMLHQRGETNPGSFTVVADEATRRRLLHAVRLDQLLTTVDQPPTVADEAAPLTVAVPDREEFGRHMRDTHRHLADLGGPAAQTFRKIAERLDEELGPVEQ